MKRLYKNLIYIIIGFLFVSLYFMSIGYFYWSLSILGINIVLIFIEKRKDIKVFFITKNLLDKCLIFGIYVLLVLMLVRNIFIKYQEKNFYWIFFILGIITISSLILKRKSIKNAFKKRNRAKISHEKFRDTKSNKVKLLNLKMQYAMAVIYVSLILVIFLHSRYKIPHGGLYWTVSILAIMSILIAIYEYKKKSIKQE